MYPTVDSGLTITYHIYRIILGLICQWNENCDNAFPINRSPIFMIINDNRLIVAAVVKTCGDTFPIFPVSLLPSGCKWESIWRKLCETACLRTTTTPWFTVHDATFILAWTAKVAYSMYTVNMRITCHSVVYVSQIRDPQWLYGLFYRPWKWQPIDMS